MELFEDNPNKQFTISQIKQSLDTEDKQYDRSNLNKSIKGLVDEGTIQKKSKGERFTARYVLGESPQITTVSPQITTVSPQITTVSPQITTDPKPQIKAEPSKITKKAKIKPKIAYWEVLSLYPTKDEILIEIEAQDTPTKRDAKAKINYKGKMKYREINNERGKRFIEYTTTIGRDLFNKKLKALLKIKE